MRKKLFVLGACLFAMFAFTACGSDSELSYEDYDLKEYIKVGEYKGLEVADYEISVTDKDIEQQIQTTLEASATTEEIDKKTPLEEGHTANIDYVGKVDGKEFDGGSAEGYDLELGSSTFIDGFEDGLIGKKIGDKVDLQLKFPEDYNAENLAGKDVVFTVTINSATKKVVPEYDLDFVKNTTDYESIKEYEASVEKEIYESKEAEAVSNQQTDLWSQALENTEVKKYPEREVNAYIQLNSDQMDEMAEAYGMTREELLASYEFGDEKEFAAVNEDSSKLRVKQEMLIEHIAAEEGLKYTDEEKEELQTQFESTGYTEEMIEQQTGRKMDDYLRMELLYQKVLEFLLENAKITEVAEE